MNSNEHSVNYDSGALVELAVDGVDYRVDAGKHGTALCISTRATGTWDWSFVGEARWDGRDLRMRAFDRALLVQLSRALAQAIEALD
jgi:hypothetical protein